MKVVIATPLYPPEVGGPATYAKHLEDGFRARGLAVLVVAYGRLERALPPGLRHLAYFVRLLPHALDARAVLALDTWSVGLPALFAARLSGARFLVRIGGDFLWESYVARTHEPVRLSDFYERPRSFSGKERLIKRGMSYLLAHADTLVFTTAWQRDLWQKAYGFTSAKATVVDNEFPSERSSTPPVGTIFVAASREHLLKQPALLARVFENIRKKQPRIELDTRTLPPSAHRKRLTHSYAVVIASVSEVNPNAAADAVRAGKPFIAPRDSGGYERLGAVGLWVDTRDEAALTKAIESLLDPSRYALECAKIRAFGYHHSWAEVTSAFLALLA